jgi:hypothetical protein
MSNGQLAARPITEPGRREKRKLPGDVFCGTFPPNIVPELF